MSSVKPYELGSAAKRCSHATDKLLEESKLTHPSFPFKNKNVPSMIK